MIRKVSSAVLVRRTTQLNSFISEPLLYCDGNKAVLSFLEMYSVLVHATLYSWDVATLVNNSRDCLRSVMKTIVRTPASLIHNGAACGEHLDSHMGFHSFFS